MKDQQINSSNENNSSFLLVTVQNPSDRSASPLTPSPSREIRGLGLFRAISRKLARRSNEDLHEDADSRSSSTDSCSSTSTGDRCARKKTNHRLTEENCESFHRHHHRSNSPTKSSTSSSAGSDTGSDTVEKCHHHHHHHLRHRHHHSTTAASFRKAFENLSVSSAVRSQSCENTKDIGTNNSGKRCSKKTNAPKRILRTPVSYTYVRGMSGLPTQRVPRSQPMRNNNKVATSCYCSYPFTANF